MIENWRPIEGFEGYSVSDAGRVRSERRFVIHDRGRGGERLIKERILRPTLSGKYWTVSLTRDGAKHTRNVAHLVVAAFIGPRPDGVQD